jgi:hypothetical protein
MIAYAAKLRKILLNYDDYYFNIIFLGYVEIHQQKCDNEACPFGTSELKIRPRNYALKILSRRYITMVVSSAQSPRTTSRVLHILL